MAENVETDSSVKIASTILPVIVYFPIIILLVLMIGFIGIKFLRIMQTPEGIAGYFNAFFQKFFRIKDVLHKFVGVIWPGPTDPVQDKSWKHIRLDTILMFGGGSFIFIMILLYNTDSLSSLKDNLIGKLLYILNPIMNFFAPNKWHGVKRNVNYKKNNAGGKIANNYPLTIGGIALFIGFVIFMSLVVKTFNKEVMTATPEEVNGKLMEKTFHYVYLSIFVGVALALFTGLLYYAATTDTAPKILSTILIILSTVIILASILVMFKDRIIQYVKNPFIQVIYNFIFLLPCLFLDLVNFIYFELKRTPRVVYGILLAEMALIITIILIPLLTKAGYIRILGDKDKTNKIVFKIEELKHKKIRLANNIEIIKNFDPVNSEVEIININSDQTVSKKTYHPSLVPVDIQIKITKHLGKFNMNANRESGIIELRGDLNIKTKNITWNSIQTKSNFKAEFSSDKQKKKCKWGRKVGNHAEKKEWNKSFLGVVSETNPDVMMAPTEFTEVPINLTELKKNIGVIITTYQYGEIEKQITKRQLDQFEDKFNKDTTVLSVMTKKLGQVIKFTKNAYKNGPWTLKMSTNKLTDSAWEKIVKDNLDNPNNIFKLEKLLQRYGYKNRKECANIMDVYESRKCLEEYNKIIKHIQYNTRHIILFNDSIHETGYEIENLEKMKKESKNIFEKGLILLNEPIYFRQKKHLAKSKAFKEIRVETHKYNYSVSCWFYIHAQPPNFKKSYNNFTEILNYNFEPVIGYDSKKNVLIIKSKRAKAPPTSKSKNYLETVFFKDKFRLQKWHNVVVNYVGGTVDVFLDGELAGSEERIVPYKTFNAMTVGQDNGISGGICNVIYYPSYISKAKIKSNYGFLKNKNPPII